jgi:hypothetical protein
MKIQFSEARKPANLFQPLVRNSRVGDVKRLKAVQSAEVDKPVISDSGSAQVHPPECREIVKFRKQRIIRFGLLKTDPDNSPVCWPAAIFNEPAKAFNGLCVLILLLGTTGEEQQEEN